MNLAADSPVEVDNRIDSLDVLRGFALLGILVMNIQSFSMIGAAYTNPNTWGSLEGADGVVWFLCHLLADSKFITLFSMMFGAGIVLMAERRAAKRLSAASLHYRRMAGLLVIGMLHGYLLWYGDILFFYAVCGSVVFLLWRLPTGWLITFGIALILLGAAIEGLLGWSIDFMPAQERVELQQQLWSPTAEQIEGELEAYRGDWLPQFSYRAATTITIQTIGLFLLFCPICGIMLLGMALFKSGVLTAERSSRFYSAMAVIGLAIGLPLIGLGVHWMRQSGWGFEYAMTVGGLPNFFGSILVALGYIGLVVLLLRSRVGEAVKKTLAPVGRMALTNYLAQSIICTTIFYGHGLAMFGTVSRVGQIGIVIAVWIVQILASIWWMKRHRFGPAEYMWRAVTYLGRP